MNTTSQHTRVLRSALDHPTRGVVGLVDDLLTVCREHDLQLDWQGGRCRMRSRGGDWEELLDLPLRKSVFRAILARLAALCNERTPKSVSPYGGQGELLAHANPPVVFKVSFANTPAEQKLELMTGTERAADDSQRRRRIERSATEATKELGLDSDSSSTLDPDESRGPPKKSRTGKLASDGRPPTVVSVTVESRRAAAFDQYLVVTVITVVLAEFGKALIGEFGKQTWEYLLARMRTIRTKAAVEIVYRGRGAGGVHVDVVLRYPSTKALREDQHQHSIYLAMATACASITPPKPGETVSLMNLLPAGTPKKPQDFLIRQHSQP